MNERGDKKRRHLGGDVLFRQSLFDMREYEFDRSHRSGRKTLPDCLLKTGHFTLQDSVNQTVLGRKGIYQATLAYAGTLGDGIQG
ncbi:hypothetical protein LNO19_16270 [Klebsiella quasipneumoniae subsp. similipneumoniae]|nr:hypothetical protein [Klebsiella quasipneumoniae subsp. similipneumoniae]